MEKKQHNLCSNFWVLIVRKRVQKQEPLCENIWCYASQLLIRLATRVGDLWIHLGYDSSRWSGFQWCGFLVVCFCIEQMTCLVLMFLNASTQHCWIWLMQLWSLHDFIWILKVFTAVRMFTAEFGCFEEISQRFLHMWRSSNRFWGNMAAKQDLAFGWRCFYLMMPNGIVAPGCRQRQQEQKGCRHAFLTLHRGFVVGKRACDGSLWVSCDPKDLLTWTVFWTLTFGVFAWVCNYSCERRENLLLGSYLRLCNFTRSLFAREVLASDTKWAGATQTGSSSFLQKLHLISSFVRAFDANDICKCSTCKSSPRGMSDVRGGLISPGLPKSDPLRVCGIAMSDPKTGLTNIR